MAESFFVETLAVLVPPTDFVRQHSSTTDRNARHEMRRYLGVDSSPTR